MRHLDSRARRWVALVTLLAALYCAGFVVAPWLEHHGITAGSWLRLAYAPSCHQIGDRCLDLGFGPFAVCARCAGLYAGGLVGLVAATLLGARVRPPLRWVVAASAPTLVDFVLALLGLPSLPNWPRFLVALVPGVVVGLLLADAVADISDRVASPGPDRRRDPVQ